MSTSPCSRDLRSIGCPASAALGSASMPRLHRHLSCRRDCPIRSRGPPRRPCQWQLLCHLNLQRLRQWQQSAQQPAALPVALWLARAARASPSGESPLSRARGCSTAHPTGSQCLTLRATRPLTSLGDSRSSPDSLARPVVAPFTSSSLHRVREAPGRRARACWDPEASPCQRKHPPPLSPVAT